MKTVEEILSQMPFPENLANVQNELDKIQKDSERFASDAAALQTMFNAIDLTTLSATDSAASVKAFVGKVNQFAKDYPTLRNVGGICVYSVFAPILKSELKVEGVKRAVVSACFPSSQTFTDIKVAEVRKAVDAGANEVDVVISVGEMIEGNYQFVFEELVALREACGEAHMKVILETGALKKPELIWDASALAMEAGADFIKTSTGKNCDGASPEAAYVMCSAIKAYVAANGRKVGFKPAGGVSTPAEAAFYYNIVRTLLGDEWLQGDLFRIGASRLANSLLAQIISIVGGKEPGKYF